MVMRVTFGGPNSKYEWGCDKPIVITQEEVAHQWAAQVEAKEAQVLQFPPVPEEASVTAEETSSTEMHSSIQMSFPPASSA
jgi:hypothetical protein